MSKPFRFGVQSYSTESPQAWRDLAKKAEDLGFSVFNLADHYIGPGKALDAASHPVQNIAALPAMTVAAEATSTIRIGCRVLCVDYHLPVILAKELATIDYFSEGRLDIGLGAGWIHSEYDAMGIEWDRAGVRIDRLEETIDLMRAFFSGEDIQLDGEHVQANDFVGVPTSGTMPPLMIGGGAPRILGLAGREADIVSLNFNNRAGKIGPDGVGLSTAEETDKKIGWIRDGAGARFDDIEIEIGAYFTFVVPNRDEMVAQFAAGFGFQPEDIADHPHCLIGSVDQICDQLTERRERFGISNISFGGTDIDAVAPIVNRLAGT